VTAATAAVTCAVLQSKLYRYGACTTAAHAMSELTLVLQQIGCKAMHSLCMYVYKYQWLSIYMIHIRDTLYGHVIYRRGLWHKHLHGCSLLCTHGSEYTTTSGKSSKYFRDTKQTLNIHSTSAVHAQMYDL
jgi:hypothetical protein